MLELQRFADGLKVKQVTTGQRSRQSHPHQGSYTAKFLVVFHLSFRVPYMFSLKGGFESHLLPHDPSNADPVEGPAKIGCS